MSTITLTGCFGPDQECIDANTADYEVCVDGVDAAYDLCLDECDASTSSDDDWDACADECDVAWDAAEVTCADEAETKDGGC